MSYRIIDSDIEDLFEGGDRYCAAVDYTVTEIERWDSDVPDYDCYFKNGFICAAFWD